MAIETFIDITQLTSHTTATFVICNVLHGFAMSITRMPIIDLEYR